MTTDAVLRINKTTGLYDISIDENGDIETADFFDTSLLYSFFGERRADENEIQDARLRRGWIGSEGREFENGSKIWLFLNSRLTGTNLARLEDEAKKGIQWLVNDDLVVSVTSKGLIVRRDNAIILDLPIFRSRDKVDRRFFELWENTGIR